MFVDWRCWHNLLCFFCLWINSSANRNYLNCSAFLIRILSYCKNRHISFAQALIFRFIILNRNPGARLKTYKTLLQAFTIHLRVPDWVERMCHVSLPLLYKGAVCSSQVEVRDYCISSVKTQAHKRINESDECNKRRLQTRKHHPSGGASKSSCSDWPVCFITLIIFPQDLKTWGFSTHRKRRGKQRFGLFQDLFLKANNAAIMASWNLSISLQERAPPSRFVYLPCPVTGPGGPVPCPAPATITGEQVQLCSLRYTSGHRSP